MTDNQITANYRNQALVQTFLTQVYGWMFAGFLTTGLLAYYTAHSSLLLGLIFGNSYTFLGLVIAEVLVVVAISSMIKSLSPTMASFLFFVYSALNGLTMSAIFLVYTSESITLVFFITAAIFGVMSLYGYVTKTDLSKMGNILLMGLLGIIITSVVNIFLKSSMVMWVTTYLGVLIFVGLTAYDTQKIKRMAQQVSDGAMLEKMAVIGALELYLDFINLFMHLLRIFGKRR